MSRQVRSIDEFRGPVDNDFMPLEEEDLSCSSTFRPAYQVKNAPAPAFEPGERGSPIPGIEQFSTPTTAEEQKVFKQVHFDTNEFTVRGVENKQIISQVTSYLKAHPRTYIYVEGHCDQRGAAAYNFSLGAKRSHAVRNQIVDAGISSDRVHTVSYGKEKLLDQGSSVEALARNRRVEFKIYTP
jgi:peptidoglycan-associated lipoprotein